VRKLLLASFLIRQPLKTDRLFR